MISNTKWPTFEELVALEPGLSKLLAEARAERAEQRANPYYCANDVWYRRFKPRLLRLVGWERSGDHEHSELSCPAAYDVAYDRIYEALPECRNCGCLRPEDIGISAG
jgi:hypothetical protein